MQAAAPAAPAAQPSAGAAKPLDAPQPITVVAGFTGGAPPAAPGAAGHLAPVAAAAPGGRSVVPLSVDSPLAGDSPTARSKEDKRKPPLYHRKVGHGPCGIFRCVGNHRPTNYMIVRPASAWQPHQPCATTSIIGRVLCDRKSDAVGYLQYASPPSCLHPCILVYSWDKDAKVGCACAPAAVPASLQPRLQAAKLQRRLHLANVSRLPDACAVRPGTCCVLPNMHALRSFTID